MGYTIHHGDLQQENQAHFSQLTTHVHYYKKSCVSSD